MGLVHPASRVLDWVFAEPPASSADAPFADLLIRCGHVHETLPELLTALAARHLLPICVGSHRNVGGAFIALRLPLGDAARIERVARALSFRSGVRSLAFRTGSGAGGILAPPPRRAKIGDRRDRSAGGKAA